MILPITHGKEMSVYITKKKALEALPQVDEAVVSHEKGTAVVKLNAEIADETLKKTVEDKDYQVVSVK